MHFKPKSNLMRLPIFLLPTEGPTRPLDTAGLSPSKCFICHHSRALGARLALTEQLGPHLSPEWEISRGIVLAVSFCSAAKGTRNIKAVPNSTEPSGIWGNAAGSAAPEL